MNPTQYSQDPSIHQLRRPLNPVSRANPVAWFTFWWLKELFQTGLKRPIEEADIYETLSSHQSEQLSYQFEHRWKLELKQERPSFLRVICGIFGWTMVSRGLLYTSVDSFSRYERASSLLMHAATKQRSNFDGIF